ncbi:rifin PIR protein, putative [Plasmodium reichenowi]|uniref:Rifin PIR protein, putative n=1 Tax=Plasmodium reichenowi TaxID=5854 RepID=A0A2P9D558_PLARE|nr:rifin PIR protein, putative [Plasmodium reichenowi]
MKLHSSKILLFFIPLNILVTLYHAHNTNKPSITTPHHTQTNRSLCECDIQSTNCDKGADMKSAKEQFDYSTSQRFEEYEERMKEKRQKRKEQRDKNIQKIIENDRMEKSLAEKIEKGCLRCGCGLGGGVLPVWGLVSGLWYATLSQYVSTTLVKEATEAGIKAGLKVGLEKVMKIVHPSVSSQTFTTPAIEELQPFTTGISGDNVTLYGIFKFINSNTSVQLRNRHQPFFTTVNTMVEKGLSGFNESYPTEAKAVTTALNEAQTGILTKGVNATSTLTTGITASIVAIVVIVLVMVIIYLVLRYRRKKKMKKKAKYTKLLKE